MATNEDTPGRGTPDNDGASGKWLVLGMAIGVGIGVAIDNISIGIAMGIALGVVIGAAGRRRGGRSSDAVGSGGSGPAGDT